MFNGSNYSYWKVRMEEFIKSMDDLMRVKLANANFMALNVIFCGVDGQEFKRIFKCSTTKKTRLILEVAMKELVL
ncbi:hypothetical protein Gohar_018951 [Gossypium harknessii]|uniref:DUF4219 domain-containing protein n=3 Tax=Gossypium TaxID=3633 RepID=A0A7J9GAN0_9ROSI|nr:hypothetical protein [Gossypium harknessii]